MMYRRVLEIVVRHEFHSGGTCPDVELLPRGWRGDAGRVIARRLVVHPRDGGIEVLAQVDGEGRPTMPLDGLRLAFDLRVSGDFIHYTDVDSWLASAPTFRASLPVGGPLVPAVGDQRLPAEVAAAIEIGGITEAWIAAAPRFTLDLKARSARWVYYLLTTRAVAASPKIEDRGSDAALTFAAAELSDETSALDDPTGRRLLDARPRGRCFRLTSATSVRCRRTPLRHLALVLGEDLLIPELANPSIRSHSRLKVAAQDKPDSTLFRVLEF